MIVVILYALFKIFNFLYKWNYCDIFSRETKYNSEIEVKDMRRCVNIPICEISNDIYVDKQEDVKKFTCIRKIKPWVWK